MTPDLISKRDKFIEQWFTNRAGKMSTLLDLGNAAWEDGYRVGHDESESFREIAHNYNMEGCALHYEGRLDRVKARIIAAVLEAYPESHDLINKIKELV